MRFQEQIVRMTQRALQDLIRAAEAFPSDRLEWSPAPTGRSALSMMQEAATSARWLLPLIESGSMPAFDDHARREAAALRASYDDLPKCVAASLAGTGELCRAILALPDSQLEQEIQVPFGGGTMMTLADVSSLHYWNLVYHLGQLSYIQTLYGDLEMH